MVTLDSVLVWRKKTPVGNFETGRTRDVLRCSGLFGVIRPYQINILYCNMMWMFVAGCTKKVVFHTWWMPWMALRRFLLDELRRQPRITG